MRKICILLMIVSSTNFLSAQNIATENSVPVVAYWQKTDVKKLSITRTTKKTEAGKTTVFNTNTCEAQLKIVDSTTEGYTIDWTYKDAGTAAKNSPELSGITSLFTNLNIRYKTDDVGSFKELVNYEEVKKFLYTAMDALFQLAKDTSGINMINTEFKKILSSRESLQQLLLRDISLYHTAYGVEYSFTPQTGETSLPNFLGGEPWPAQLSLKLSQLKTKEDFAQVQMNQEIDQEKAAIIMKQFISRIAASQGKEVPKDALPSVLIIKDHNEFDIVLSSGWIKRAYMKRMARSGDVEKVDTYEILMN